MRSSASPKPCGSCARAGENGEVVAGSAEQDKQVPDEMRVAAALADEEKDAAGVGETPGKQPDQASHRHSEHQGAKGDQDEPAHEQTATLLPDGRVLVAGGADTNPQEELYDPASGTWTSTAGLIEERNRHTATLLPGGKVLVTGGVTPQATRLASAELYDVGLGFSGDWKPDIKKVPRNLITENQLSLQGSRFKGISQASGGGNQDSSTNYPIVQLRSIDNSQVAFLPVDPIRGWSDTAFRSVPVRDFPPGPALVTVFTNGISSEAKSVIVTSSQ